MDSLIAAAARARCVVAEAEVALAMRDLRGSPRTLAAASAALEARADRANALQARLIAVRRLLLLGRLDEAASALAGLDARGLPPPLLAVAELAAAEVALRSLRTAPAQAALARAPSRGGRGARRARSSRRPARPRRPRAVTAPRRGRSASRLGRAGGRRLPSRPARRRHLAAAGAPAGAVRVGARARRGVARRRRSAHPDRARVRRPPPQRVAPGAPARRDRPFARARRAAGPHRGQRARLRAHAAGRARRHRPGTTHRWGSGVAPGAARRRRGLVHLCPRAGPRSQPAHRPARTRRVGGRQTGALHRARTRTALAVTAAGRIHDDLVTPRRAATRVDWSCGAVPKRAAGARR